MWHRKIIWLVLVISACQSSTITPPSPSPAAEVIFYDWANDLPQTVLDRFAEEEGISVQYLTYETVEEANQTVMAGAAYDVVVLDNDTIPTLLAAGHLQELDQQLIPNMKNIDPAFRDLYYDPGNHFCIPFNWGTTGLLVRQDLVERLPTHWSDLWSPDYAGKIGLVSDPRTMVGITLLVRGYPFNSADPQELASAAAYLEQLRPAIAYLAPEDDAVIAEKIVTGEAAIAVAYSGGALTATEQSDEVQYILPEEGALLWGDNFCVPANSPNPTLAYRFLNYLLRADIAAEIALYNHYATANLAARETLPLAIRSNTVMYPPHDYLANASIYAPLSPNIEKQYQAIMVDALGDLLPSQE